MRCDTSPVAMTTERLTSDFQLRRNYTKGSAQQQPEIIANGSHLQVQDRIGLIVETRKGTAAAAAAATKKDNIKLTCHFAYMRWVPCDKNKERLRTKKKKKINGEFTATTNSQFFPVSVSWINKTIAQLRTVVQDTLVHCVKWVHVNARQLFLSFYKVNKKSSHRPQYAVFFFFDFAFRSSISPRVHCTGCCCCFWLNNVSFPYVKRSYVSKRVFREVCVCSWKRVGREDGLKKQHWLKLDETTRKTGNLRRRRRRRRCRCRHRHRLETRERKERRKGRGWWRYASSTGCFHSVARPSQGEARRRRWQQ